MRLIAGLIALLGMLLLQGAQAQQMYRWVDKNGRVTYSQEPPPPGAAKNVQQRRLNTSVVEGADLPYAAQVATRNFPVVMYTAPDCGPPCATGRDYLGKRGIPYKEVVSGDDASIEALKKLSGGTRVPVLQVGRQVLDAGFEPSGWAAALDQAGYPQSIPPTTRRPDPKVQRNLPVVKLFTSAQCGTPCQSAKDLLTGRAINFQEVSVDAEAGLEELKKAGGASVLPLLSVGGSQSQGFEAGRYNSMLDAAGFTPPAAKK